MTAWVWTVLRFTRCSLLSFLHCGTRFIPPPKALRKYLDDEHLDKKKKPFDFTGWEDWNGKVRVLPFEWWTPISFRLITSPQNTPQQENGYDCGVFTCQFLQALSRGEDFGFSQVDMP